MLRKANYTIDVQEIFNQNHRSHVFKYQALEKTFTAESFFQRSFPGVLFLLLESPLGLWHLGEHSPEISFFHCAQPQACCGKQSMTDLNKHATKMHAQKRRQGNTSSSWFLAGSWRSSCALLAPCRQGWSGHIGYARSRGKQLWARVFLCLLASGLVLVGSAARFNSFYGDINNKWVSHSATDCSVVGQLLRI